MIGHKERVVEGGEAADGIEARVFDLLDTGAILFDGIVCVLIGRWGILLIDRRGIADGGAVDDVDDKGVDIGRFGVFDIGVDIAEHLGIAGQVERIAGVWHDVVFKIRLLARIVVERSAVSAAPAVLPAHMDGIGAEAVIDLRGKLRRGRGIFAADIAGGFAVCDMVEVDNAV